MPLLQHFRSSKRVTQLLSHSLAGRVLRVAKRKYGGNEYSPERLSIDSTVWAPFHWHLDPGARPLPATVLLR